MLIKDVVYRSSVRLLNWKSLLNSTTVDGAVDLTIQLSVEVGLVALISSVVLMPCGIRVIWAPPFVGGALTRPVASCCPHRRTSCCGTRGIPGHTPPRWMCCSPIQSPESCHEDVQASLFLPTEVGVVADSWTHLWGASKCADILVVATCWYMLPLRTPRPVARPSSDRCCHPPRGLLGRHSCMSISIRCPMTELLQSWTWCSGHCWIPKPNVELRQVHLLWTWLLIQLPPVVGASNMPCWTSWCSCCPAALAVGPCSLWTRTGSSVHCWSWSGPQCSGKRLLLQPVLGSCWGSPCQNSAWVLTHWSPWSVLLPHPSWLRGVLLWCKATTFPCRCCRSRRGMPVVPGMLRWQPMRAWWLVLSIRLLSKTTLLAFWWLALWSRRCWSTTLCWFTRRCWSSQFELLRNHCGCGNENENVEAGCCQQNVDIQKLHKSFRWILPLVGPEARQKRKTCCVLQTCCMGHVHVPLHVVHTHVEVVHIENHVEVLDGISCWYTPWCSYSERSINHCWSHGWE